MLPKQKGKCKIPVKNNIKLLDILVLYLNKTAKTYQKNIVIKCEDNFFYFKTVNRISAQV